VVHRVQVEQNFQRIRWYAEPVHRIFKKGTVKKVGHTTDRHAEAGKLGFDDGLLWDCTNNFRDNFLARIDQQAKLWGSCNYNVVPQHFTHQHILLTREQIEEFLKEPHWEYKTTMLNIPDILKPLVGKTKYDS
jgi:hypothetical protein